MSTRPTLSAVVTAALVTGGCYSGYQIENPFVVPQEGFGARVTRLALAPTLLLSPIEDASPVALEFDSLIEATVREASFTLVPAREWSAVLEEVATQVGDLFEATSAVPDSFNLRAYRQRAVEEAASRFDVDAVLFPTIEVLYVRFEGGNVKWLGTEECINRRQILGCGQFQGTAAADALFVTIVDTDGNVLYRNGGGIQLLTRLEPLGFGQALAFTLRGGTLGEAVPRDQLFVDKEQHVAAVRIALAPFLAPQ